MRYPKEKQLSSLPASQESVADQKRYVCGYPKTGRTWLRFMMAHALVREFDLGINIDLNNVYSVIPNDTSGLLPGQSGFEFENTIPKIEMSHLPYSSDTFAGQKLIFMTRDPRDIMVSKWLHDTLQVELFDGPLSAYIREPSRGIASFLSHLESWAPNLTEEQVVTYEGLHKAPNVELKGALNKLGVSVSNESVNYGVTQSDINRMRKIEIAHGIAGHNYDRTNAEARRIRAGKIGGYVNYLAEADLVFIDEVMQDSSEAARVVISKTPYPLNQE